MNIQYTTDGVIHGIQSAPLLMVRIGAGLLNRLPPLDQPGGQIQSAGKWFVNSCRLHCLRNKVQFRAFWASDNAINVVGRHLMISDLPCAMNIGVSSVNSFTVYVLGSILIMLPLR
jgi:hypothetical protein